jgi:predicted O-methyltransferase YrrM
MTAIDEAHCKLIYGLVVSQKPTSVLELGFGEGVSGAHISEALAFNDLPFDYTIVDNWYDWGGIMPDNLRQIYGAHIVQSDEGAFIGKAVERGAKWDFVLSDADHHNCEQWFWKLYTQLLNDGGIVALHDITNPGFPNLESILVMVRSLNYRHALFNKSSRREEECSRGLLIVFK